MRRLLSFAILIVSAQAWGAGSSFISLPDRFHTRDLTAGSRALGEICLSRDSMPDGTVCNPAFQHELKDSSILARAYLGNGYSALSTANNLVFSSISKEFLVDLFRSNNVTSLEANVAMVFTTPSFSAEFAPYRVQYFSEVHNPNLPVVAVHAAVERAFSIQAGTQLGESDFSLGGRVRLLQRQYVHGNFALLDAVGVNDPRSLLPVRTDRALWLDPSLGWKPRRAPWGLRLSVGAYNLGVKSSDNPLYREKTDLTLGLGLEPPVGFGRLRLGVDAVNLIHGETPESRLRAGASYKLGIMETMLGANQSLFSAGLGFGLQPVQVGVVYEFVRTDYSLASSPQSRISTEFAVRL